MNRLERYFLQRQGLIEQYLKGDMTKTEYLEQNLDMVLSLNIKPFKNVDTLEKALFNYQYYNAMAKNARIQSKNYSDKILKTNILTESEYYYDKKDKATIDVLKILDFRDVQAYFIKVKSKHLKGKLFEIVINKYGMILHSRSEIILRMLRDEYVFKEEIRTSLIDYYINQKY